MLTEARKIERKLAIRNTLDMCVAMRRLVKTTVDLEYGLLLTALLRQDQRKLFSLYMATRFDRLERDFNLLTQKS